MRASLLILLTFWSINAAAEVERLEAWGSGPSEFAAVKAGSKDIAAQAIKLVLGQAATLEHPARREFERQIEEDFTRYRSTFFPQMVATCQPGANVECHVVAPVLMDEVRAAISTYIATSNAAKLSVALTASKAGTGNHEDALRWLHSALELELGHDVYFVPEYVSPEALRGDCAPYSDKVEEMQRKGGNFAKTLQVYQRSLDTCRELLDRDAIIVVESIDVLLGQYDTGAGSMTGQIKSRLSFHRTAQKRPLPAPRPLSITKYGYGESADFAQAQLFDALYADSASYISQQYNEIVLSKLAASTTDRSAEHRVRVVGLARDSSAGRQRHRFVRDWFAARVTPLEFDASSSSYEETVYFMNTPSAVDWLEMTDELSDALDDQRFDAVIDIERAGGVTIAFGGEGNSNDPQVALNDRTLRRAIKIESADLKRVRRDPASGVSLSINEAQVTLRNKHRKDYLVWVTPVWLTTGGVEIKNEFSQQQYILLRGKSTETFRIRAPGRTAAAITLELSCNTRSCQE